MISVDSVDPDVHDRSREGAYKRAMVAVKLLLASDVDTVDFSCTVDRYNYDAIPDLVALALRTGVHAVSFMQNRSNLRDVFDRAPWLRYEQVCRDIYELMLRRRGRLYIHTHGPFMLTLPDHRLDDERAQAELHRLQPVQRRHQHGLVSSAFKGDLMHSLRCRFLFAFAPTKDMHDRFFNCYPSSLLHAVAPLVHAVDSGELEASYCDRIYHPKVFSEAAESLWRLMLQREQPTHVAISSTYDSWHIALLLGRVAREILPEVIIIQGGPHLDEVLEPFVLRRTPELDPLSPATRDAVDFAVGGDGEHILRWLAEVTCDADGHVEAAARVQALQAEAQLLPGTANLVYFVGDDRQTMRFRNPMPLDDLPFVPRHLLPVEDLYDFDCFRDEAGRRKPSVTMITHRGCRARCNFCSEGLPYQGRSHAHILAEARELAETGVRAVFLDDSTVQDDPLFTDLLRGFHDLGLEIGALTRFDQIQDEHSLAHMRDLGLVYLYASVEQYSDHSLDLMHKKLHTEQIDRGVANCSRASIRLGVSLLFGLPYETADSVASTLDYATRLRDNNLVEYVSMSLYSYHPRTPLGQMRRQVLGGFDFNQGPPNLRPPYTSFEEGSWYHPDHVTDDYVESIRGQAHAGFGDRLVRELAKHRGSMAEAPVSA